ncbi:MAG: ATP-binding protein [Ruminococcus sp.]|jgi:two-component system sensor histidine kinase VanS
MAVKHSIRRQVALIFIGLMLLALLTVALCNRLFLEDYYVASKMKILVEGMDFLNENDISEGNSDFSLFCSNNNLSYAVASVNYSHVYTNMVEENGELLAARLFGYMAGIDTSDPTVLEKTDQYTIQKNEDIRRETTYVEIWGELDNRQSFIIRTPLESIRESVVVSSRFYLYIGLSVGILATFIIWFVTKRLTRPVIELTEMSQKMAALDFDVRYESGGDDEIGVLGYNFNAMSEKLERTISELKSANNELQKDIEKKTQIDEMRKEFLSNVSHELKTPIALIQGYAEGLQDNINEDEESRQFYCEVIIDEAVKMNKMVKKLLTLNQLEFGNDQITMERFDIASLIRGVIQSSSILVEQKQVQVIFNQKDPVYVWGDEFKVEEVVTNYFTNALNHVKNENIVEIRCILQEEKVRVTVFNTGDPIPEEDIDKIWIKFYKVDKARTRAYGGSGIGLSIVKAIMESMNQQCGVKNYENGVEFWFELESKA